MGQGLTVGGCVCVCRGGVGTTFFLFQACHYSQYNSLQCDFASDSHEADGFLRGQQCLTRRCWESCDMNCCTHCVMWLPRQPFRQLNQDGKMAGNFAEETQQDSKSHGIRNWYNLFSFFLKVQMVVRLAEAEGPFNFDEAAGKHWRISFWHKSLQQSRSCSMKNSPFYCFLKSTRMSSSLVIFPKMRQKKPILYLFQLREFEYAGGHTFWKSTLCERAIIPNGITYCLRMMSTRPARGSFTFLCDHFVLVPF